MKYFIFIVMLAACGTPTIQVDYPATPVPTPVVSENSTPTPSPTTPSATAIPSPTPSATPTPSPSPSPTPTPTPTPQPSNCVLSQVGSQSRGFTNTHNGQPFIFTIQGSISCTNGNPDLFTLFAWQIQNYCNVAAFPTHCELTMGSITGSFSVTSQTNNHNYVLPVLTVPIPNTYY